MISDRSDLLVVGEIGKPHGLNGEVYVVVISDDPQRFAPGSELVGADGGRLVIRTARRHNERLLVMFEGVSTREEAARLKGALYVDAERVRALSADEFWPHDLAGCDVIDTQGEGIGRVERVVERPPQDLLEIDTSNGLRSIPFVAPIVVAVDLEARRIVIDPPEGLLD